MAHGVTIDFAGLGFPARTTFAIATTTSGIEAKPSNDHEGMAVTNINRDPVALTFFPVVEESLRSQVALHETGLAEDVASGSAAVVTGVVEVGMTAPIFVRLVEEPVGSGDCEFDPLRCKEGGASFSVRLDVDRPHEFLLVLDGSFSPFLIATTTDESEAGEKKEKNIFH